MGISGTKESVEVTESAIVKGYVNDGNLVNTKKSGEDEKFKVSEDIKNTENVFDKKSENLKDDKNAMKDAIVLDNVISKELKNEQEKQLGKGTEKSDLEAARYEELKTNVEDVKEVMRENVIKIRDRDHRLSALEKKADDLHEMAGQFQKVTKRARQKMWLRSRKRQIIIICVIIAVIIILTLISVLLYITGTFDNKTHDKPN